MTEPTDEDLVEAILGGQRDRFEELVARYQSRLVNYLARLMRDDEDARDLAQEVFVENR